MEATGFLCHAMPSQKNSAAFPLNFETNTTWFQQLDQLVLDMFISKTMADVYFIR